jgi:hypothetical protein
VISLLGNVSGARESDQEMSKPDRRELKKQKILQEEPEVFVNSGQRKSRGA